MKARSIQFKFLATVISAILAIAIFVGGLSLYEVDGYIQEETENLIHITCSNEASQINDIFGDIEKSVRIMESYVLSVFEKTADILNRNSQREILDLAGELFVDIAVNTDGVNAYYLRFDPAISDGKAGIFYSKMNGGEEYISLEPTDLSLYDKSDTEHVGWFWQPYEAGHAIWLAPYFNQNINALIISYVVPLYLEGQFVGIVGMDFDYTLLTERVHKIKIYEHGFAHLEMDNTVIHNGNESQSGSHTHEDSDEYLRVSKSLANGMTLVLSASYADISEIRHEIAYKVLISVLLLATVFSVIVFFMVKKLVLPLKKLTESSEKLSRGDYNITLAPSDTHEIQRLSAAFENMTMKLREHERLQHDLAYRDSLTGLKNTTSYKSWVLDFDKRIQEEQPPFGVAVFDLNELKEANDTHGHNAGDKLIATAAHIIADTFKRSPVFRIGGDEFAVILQGRDLEELDALLASLESMCESACIEEDGARITVSIAMGSSVFDPERDRSFADVFKRADEEMYKNKKSAKQVHA